MWVGVDLGGKIDHWISGCRAAVAMTAYGPGGGYVEQRAGAFVAAGLSLGLVRREEEAERCGMATLSFQVERQVLVVSRRQLHCCAVLTQNNLQ